MHQARSVRRQPMTPSVATIACMPRLRRRQETFSTPISLFNRLREVLLRLIMFSSPVSRTKEMHQSPPARPRVYQNLDSHRTEAVQDCIEFFKRSAVLSQTEKSECLESRDENKDL
jgi:hypothetical protein